MNFPNRAAARAVCLGSHAARGDHSYGGCDSARVARLGSHTARGGRTARSSASMMRMVVMARPAQCVRSGRCSWRFATIIILAPHPENIYLLGCALAFNPFFVVVFVEDPRRPQHTPLETRAVPGSVLLTAVTTPSFPEPRSSNCIYTPTTSTRYCLKYHVVCLFCTVLLAQHFLQFFSPFWGMFILLPPFLFVCYYSRQLTQAALASVCACGFSCRAYRCVC